jgi:protein-tyrosine phosphatase
MIDLHCHILPGVDDGPRTLEDAITMCRAAYRDGTRTLVATPHVNGDYPGVTADLVLGQTVAVNRALRAAAVDVSVQTGAEVALSRLGELSDHEIDRLGLGGGRYVLIELPWTSAAAGAMSALRAFAGRGYGIVLAHPERSPMLQDAESLVAELAEAGVLCCLDVGSLGERADRRSRSAAWSLLSAGLVHVIASDCHDPVKRPPRLASALRRAGLRPDQIDYFTRLAPEAILRGDVVAPPPQMEARRRRRWLGRR